ncbi:MAG: hypothetical protein EBW84_11745, partial [Betaproteobacteria bacterium]|nr:hypothetical protein [Betaproteobacteria bacterium]
IMIMITATIITTGRRMTTITITVSRITTITITVMRITTIIITITSMKTGRRMSRPTNKLTSISTRFSRCAWQNRRFTCWRKWRMALNGLEGLQALAFMSTLKMPRNTSGADCPSLPAVPNRSPMQTSATGSA